MRLLITGGAGFIGYHYSKRRLEQGDQVWVWDDLSRKGSRERLDQLRAMAVYPQLTLSTYPIQHGGLAEYREFATEAVVHLAGQVAVTCSLNDPLDDFRRNVAATLTLLETIRQAGPPFPKVLYASTNKVYGPNLLAHPVNERAEVNLRTPYAISKGAADAYCREYGRRYGLPTVVLRQSCCYGPFQSASADQGWLAHFTDRILTEQELTIYGDGNQRRDVLYIDDLLDLYDKILETNLEPGMVLNVGGGPRMVLSLLAAVRLLEELTGKRASLTFSSARPDDQAYYVSSILRAQHLLQWDPKVAPHDGLKRLVEWLLQRIG